MHCLLIVRVAVALAFIWSMASGAEAQQASPVPALVPVPATECTVAPRSQAELRRITLDGIRDYVAGATPVPLVSHASKDAEPANAETIAAVTATIRGFTACSNAGNIPAIAAFGDDDMMRRPLGRVAVFAGHVLTGRPGTPVPAETPTAAALNLYLAALQFPQPPPKDRWTAILEIRDVRVFSDRQVVATVVTASQAEPTPTTTTVYLQKSGEDYLYTGEGALASPDADAEFVATPFP